MNIIDTTLPVPIPTELSHGFTIHRPDATRAWIKAGIQVMNGNGLSALLGGTDCLIPGWGLRLQPVLLIPISASDEVTIEMERAGTGLAVFGTQAEDDSGPEKRKVIRDMV